MRNIFIVIIWLGFYLSVFAQTNPLLITPVDSLFRAEVPLSSDHDRVYELGTEFQALSNGYIIKARLFTHLNEGGNHIIRLWMFNGSAYNLVAGPFTWNITSGIQGWREFELPAPFEVFANTRYIISISNSSDYYYVKSESFTAFSGNLHLSYLRGLYNLNLGAVPAYAYNNSSYFRDIVFALPDVNGNLTPGSIGTPQSICYNATPSALTQLTAPTGGTGVYTYQWQSSPDNSDWTNINGATLSDFSPPSLSASAYYRRTVTSGTYNPVYSNAVLITVTPQVTLAQLHDNISIENNTSVNFNVAINGGTSPFTINYTRNGVALAAINNYTSGTNISTGVLTTGVYTYALTSVTDANNCSAQNLGTSIAVTVTDNGNLTPGSIGAPQSICYNATPSALTQLTAPTGGTGVYTYQWQSSPDNSAWTNINGETLSGFSPPSLSASAYYRRTVTSGTYNPVYSNAVLITVTPQVTLAQLHDNISIENNTSVNFNVAINGGTSPFTINYTLSGVVQSAINNYTSGTNISTGVLSTGVYTYALTSVTDANGCSALNLGTSIAVTVTDNGNLTPGSIGSPQSICYNTVPSALTQLTAPTGGTGVYTYQWQSSPDNSVWTNVNGATLSGFSPPVLTASAYYRRTVTSGTFNPVYSNAVLITVTPQVTLAQLHDNISIENNTSVNFNVAINGGTSPFSINYTRNGVAQAAINNYTSGTNISTGVLSTGVYTYALTSVTNANGCSAQNLGTSIAVTVTDNGNLTPGSIGAPQSICYNATPSALTQLTAPTGGTGVYTYQWQSSPDNSAWTNINGETLSGFSPPSLSASAYYRRTVTSGTYNPVYSNAVLITVTPQVTLAQLHDNISIENNTSVNFNVAINGGTSPFTINYTLSGVVQSAINNYTSGTNISTGVLSTGVYTYALTSVTDANGCSALNLGTSIAVTVTDNGNLTPGSIGSPQSICYNTVPSALTQLTAPTGGTGVYTYQWQSSPDNSVWTNVNGATLSGFSPPVLTASAYYRRTVTSGTFNPVYSNAVLITVTPQVTLAQLHDNISIENNTSVNFNVAINGGTSPFSINYTRNGVAQAAINNYTSGTNISTGVLSTGVYTYALTSVTDANNCSAQNLGTSIAVTVTDNGNLTPGSIGAPQSICYNSAPAALTQLTAPTGGTGVYAFQWQSSPDNSAWTNINGATLSGFSPPSLSASAYYRRTVTSGTYNPVYSNAVLITVTPQVTLAQLHDNISIENNTSVNFNVAINGGTSPFTINYTRNGVAQSAINNYTSGTNISTGVLTTGVYTYALTSVTDANGCSAQNLGTSIAVTVTDNGNLTPGSIGAPQSICYNSAPAALTQLTAPTGGTGVYAFQWQSSPDNSSWANINGATLSGYSPTALTASAYYRRTVTSGIFTPVLSNSVLITVAPQITLVQLHDNISIANNTSVNFNVAINGGTSPFTINYTRNGVAQSAINNYTSGTNISTGVLTTGVYTYVLTSVTDANGCSAQNLGTSIAVTVTDIIPLSTATLYSTEIPVSFSNDTRYELGTEFQVLSDGLITKARLFTHFNEGGDHIIRLWMFNGTNYTLAAGPFTWNFTSGIQGWREFNLPTPVGVTANTRYIISITNSINFYYVKSETFSSVTVNDYVRYLRGLYTTNLGTVPSSVYNNSSYFRDVVFAIPDVNGNLTAGTIGASQSICYNATPSTLNQLTAPTGGTSVYTYQWQSSPDNSAWTNINGATLSGYSPTALTASAYYRRTVTSGTYNPVYSNAVLITVTPQVTLAQLHDNISIANNTSVNFNVAINGGTSPFTINYTRNGVAQSAINNYTSGTNISTGVLTTGVYTYALTSVTDANGCSAQNLGTSIAVTVTDNGNLTPGSIGAPQSICYNSAPAALTQLTAPTGGTGVYAFQWQSSPDNSSWANINGATLSGYSPTALTASAYYRRTVTSGIFTPVLSNSVLITVAPQITLVQLHDNISIANNTSVNFNVAINGGTSPFTINYTRNGVAQSAINNYTSGTNISTGVLTTGVYTYVLTSVTDANGCSAQNLGTSIAVTVTDIIPLSTATLYSTEIPVSFSNDTRYELGTEFQVLSDGLITKARLFTHFNEGGDHIIRLWMFNGTNYTLAAGPFTWNFTSGIQGWREFNLPTPVGVTANTRYIISITNSINFYYVKSETFSSVTVNDYVRYLRGLYTTNLGTVPSSVYNNSSYFRDVVFAIPDVNGNLTAGTIGASQSICYNATPSTLNQLTAPTGGTSVYTYQWQSSPDNSAWTNINGATLSGYSPTALTASSYFRRTVFSGSYNPVFSNSILINVFSQAQLHDNITIYNNTSANFNITFSGGIAPYTVNYTRNGVAQNTISNYSNGTNISTGILTTGEYIYTLTSATDASGCSVQNPGTNITVSVTNDQYFPISSNKAVVVVNSASAYYSDYVDYIQPYLNNFGIPYDIVNTSTTALPDFNDYALIILGHKNVFLSGYPINKIDSALYNGTGLFSLDPDLFNFSSGFNSLVTEQTVSSNIINISDYTHYITSNHAPDIYDPTSNTINLYNNLTVVQNSNLVNGVNLVSVNASGVTIPLLQVSQYGSGKIVKWNEYGWVFDNILGPVKGMDDLLWRGIVWSARKPFVMQGIPPMITMRVDDVEGTGGELTNNFEWIRICNEFGIIPWAGTFIDAIPSGNIPTLKNLLDSNLATASPHAFSQNNFIFYNHHNVIPFDAAANTRIARDYFLQNGLKISKYMIPHYYEISSDALPEVHNMGIEFIGIQMLPDNPYNGSTPWINNASFRINRNGQASSTRPVYYAGNNNFNGLNFFNCLAEIRDDGGYEWYPDNTVFTTSARGIRHLRRSLNSMVLPSLFTHEYFFNNISISNFREILNTITSSISAYNPEFTSTDHAIQYIRAKNNIRITDVTETLLNVEISYSGNNDMETKCYLFTEQNNQITYRLINLPQTNGSSIVSVFK